ncbi:MAG: hypothetical protein IJR93_02500, partial [Treponema sp.]|nr:hypothetical protein [Treponema sp.]MBQ7165805.1 hypothetical protein [Treponema sp.]
MNRSYNYGLACLRMLMCFEVILIHFWTDCFSDTAPVYLRPFKMLRETLIKDRILPLYPSGTKNLEILAEKSAALSFSAPSGACGMGFPQG